VRSLSISIFATLTFLSAQSSTAQDLDKYAQLARDVFQELIELNTTLSTGDMIAASRAMEKRFLDAGFPAEDVVVTEIAPRKGNVIARLRGRDTGQKPILLMAHIDVVEANPEDWTLPPFTFIERDGIFYGRGVSDDKDEAAIYVANLIRMREEGFVPDRDIIVALTTDEEGGPNNGIQWLLENRPDLIDAAYALNEGGGGTLSNGQRISNNVQASEKKYLNFIFEVTNPGGHSSRPTKDNAIYQLAEALIRVGAFDFPVGLNEVTRTFFERTAAIVDPETAAAMRAIVANENDATAATTLARDPAYNARLRTTCVATLLDGGHAPNALPQRAQANVNCRILPDDSPDRILATLRRVANSPNVTITPEDEAIDSPASPLTPEILNTVERITEEMWPGVPVIPTMSTGATDGLYLRNAGIPVYGVSGLFYGDTFAHGMNERIPVRSFFEGQEFLFRLVKALTSGGVSE
jgi:acetylornithine deacetylase/succinyl-diaminopimelate desuccinylase-like protein